MASQIHVGKGKKKRTVRVQSSAQDAQARQIARDTDMFCKRVVRHTKALGVQVRMSSHQMMMCMSKVWNWQTLAYEGHRALAYTLSPFHLDQPLTPDNAIPLSEEETKARESGLLDIPDRLASIIQDVLDDIHCGMYRPYQPTMTPVVHLISGHDMFLAHTATAFHDGRVQLGAPNRHVYQYCPRSRADPPVPSKVMRFNYVTDALPTAPASPSDAGTSDSQVCDDKYVLGTSQEVHQRALLFFTVQTVGVVWRYPRKLFHHYMDVVWQHKSAFSGEPAYTMAPWHTSVMTPATSIPVTEREYKEFLSAEGIESYTEVTEAIEKSLASIAAGTPQAHVRYVPDVNNPEECVLAEPEAASTSSVSDAMDVVAPKTPSHTHIADEVSVEAHEWHTRSDNMRFIRSVRGRVGLRVMPIVRYNAFREKTNDTYPAFAVRAVMAIDRRPFYIISMSHRGGVYYMISSHKDDYDFWTHVPLIIMLEGNVYNPTSACGIARDKDATYVVKFHPLTLKVTEIVHTYSDTDAVAPIEVVNCLLTIAPECLLPTVDAELLNTWLSPFDVMVSP